MSCIVGIINLDDAPVDRELLERMTRTMKDRAPDEIGLWCSGNVGFGHAMLRISPESGNEHQPCTLDGKLWITADARIDGRTELISQLRTVGKSVRNDAPDVELILHSYNAFGESFLDRLIGDFAFALWDERRTKLICARDHFGVRPLYYARTDRAFLFASDIDALLEHPAVSRVLDEEAIADFLLFGAYQERDSSIYRDIRKLPAASVVKFTSREFDIRRYWTLPLNTEVRHKKYSEYVDQFQELFSKAVNERVRTNNLAIELSGGMDSTSIAAEVAKSQGTNGHTVTAYTTTCHGLLPGDQDGHYAGIVAAHLGIPIVYQACEEYGLFECFDKTELFTAEPIAHPDLAAHYDNYVHMGKNGSRVLVSGQGGDAVFNGSSTYYADLLRGGRAIKFLLEAYRHASNTGSLAGMGLRSSLTHTANQNDWCPSLPEWINADFAKRVDLKERWHAGWRELNGRSDAYDQLQRPWLSQTFEAYEALKMPIQARHPFFDVRLVKLLLGLPNFSKSGKRIMREAMRGKLPEAILTRPKTTLAGDQIRAKFAENRLAVKLNSRSLSFCSNYVDSVQYAQAYENYLGGKGLESTWSSAHMISPIALDNWLGIKSNST